MSSQDAPETPMNEVLASIRNIMQENKKPYHPSLDNAECSDPFNRMPKQPAFAGVQHKQNVDDNIEKEVNKICTSINRIIQKPETVSNKVFSLNVNNHDANNRVVNNPATNNRPAFSAAAPQQAVAQSKSDSSSLIVRQFNTFFAERRNKNPQLDNTISNVAQTAVINEVVPVLQQWIDECLPSLIREEIKRVIAKAGPR
ncbi:MAG: DUF2497 domain-containing protein [Alphaproteobacteria bacterium]|nr:DUF2497 domain-containing protein [Alphaproteobacteria bacterium]